MSRWQRWALSLSLLLAIATTIGMILKQHSENLGANAQRHSAMTENEPYRPGFHFTPAAQWLNDPNGLVFYKGEYHLFYQYYPEDTIWGPMHWGHAVSGDLINWTHLPIALYPDELGYIYSGSAVIDWQNTAVFGPEAMVAIFTHHDPDSSNQSQSLAYSLDRGRTWTKHAGNPVIPTPNNLRNFRDPKVFWYEEGQEAGHWVMVLAAGNAVLFYTSPDLKSWDVGGGFGFGYGSTEGVWETPDLFQLPVGDGPESRWVLTVGVGDGAPAGGSGTQYFVGDFDGYVFNSENPKDLILWADWGADFYAAQSWSGIEDGRRIWLAWLNNWRYATSIPTSSWRGAMSLPREVSLTETQDGVRLVQKPVAEFARLRGERYAETAVTIKPGAPFVPDIEGDLFEIIAGFQVDPGSGVVELGLRIGAGAAEATTISYFPKGQYLAIDRRDSGRVSFSADFAGMHTVKMAPVDGAICLHIFVDRSSIEIFGNDGQISISDLIFPTKRPFRLEFYAVGGQVELRNLEVYLLNSATFQTEKENAS